MGRPQGLWRPRAHQSRRQQLQLGAWFVHLARSSPTPSLLTTVGVQIDTNVGGNQHVEAFCQLKVRRVCDASIDRLTDGAPLSKSGEKLIGAHRQPRNSPVCETLAIER